MKTKEKTCVDCLHCKVSARSRKNNRLCFCAEKAKREQHKETYWLTKPACKKFIDMVEIKPRRPLLIMPSIAERVVYV